MQVDPISERQRLTAQYREMSDDELRDLAADITDLTENAREVLRSELQNRGPHDLPANGGAQGVSDSPLLRANEGVAPGRDSSVLASEAARNPDEAGRNTADSAADGPIEYTWKTLLCACDTSQQANELSEALRKAGIESWIEQPRDFYSTSTRIAGLAGLEFAETESLRVMVAADQLDQARAIAAQPITRDIVDESEMKVPDYIPPTCPKCSAGDPVLDGVDPSNKWRCEQCGASWSDPAPTVG